VLVGDRRAHGHPARADHRGVRPRAEPAGQRRADRGRSAARVALFESAWWRHVGPGRLVRSTDPEGAALLELLRGADPFALTSRLRTVWR
jgi:hypothetical protein